MYFPGTQRDTVIYIFLSFTSGKFSWVTLKISYLMFAGFFLKCLLVEC